MRKPPSYGYTLPTGIDAENVGDEAVACRTTCGLSGMDTSTKRSAESLKFRGELEPLSPYKPPRMSLEAAAEQIGPDGSPNGGYVKLTSNELSFGPLPEAEMAMQEALPRLNRYPDRHSSALREAVAEANFGTDPSNVLVGNGSSEVLFNLLQLVERPGEVVSPWPSFGLYNTISTILGLRLRKVPLAEDHQVDLDALRAAVASETRSVILSNPNNPTGT